MFSTENNPFLFSPFSPSVSATSHCPFSPSVKFYPPLSPPISFRPTACLPRSHPPPPYSVSAPYHRPLQVPLYGVDTEQVGRGNQEKKEKNEVKQKENNKIQLSIMYKKMITDLTNQTSYKNNESRSVYRCQQYVGNVGKLALPYTRPCTVVQNNHI